MLFKKSKKKKKLPFEFNRIYQYKNGEYLPDTSQPIAGKNFAINSYEYTPHKSTRYINIEIGENGKPKRTVKDGNKEESNMDLPELYTVREDCCGCTACYAVCPADAIQMLPCEEGFLYPVVDAYKCLRCYKCLVVCPIKKADSTET